MWRSSLWRRAEGQAGSLRGHPEAGETAGGCCWLQLAAAEDLKFPDSYADDRGRNLLEVFWERLGPGNSTSLPGHAPEKS